MITNTNDDVYLQFTKQPGMTQTWTGAKLPGD